MRARRRPHDDDGSGSHEPAQCLAERRRVGRRHRRGVVIALVVADVPVPGLLDPVGVDGADARGGRPGAGQQAQLRSSTTSTAATSSCSSGPAARSTARTARSRTSSSGSSACPARPSRRRDGKVYVERRAARRALPGRRHAAPTTCRARGSIPDGPRVRDRRQPHQHPGQPLLRPHRRGHDRRPRLRPVLARWPTWAGCRRPASAGRRG